MTNYYGFESSEDIEFDKVGAPVGTYKVMAIAEEPDVKGRGIVVEFEILEGDFKGKRFKNWFLTLHDSAQTANIAKQNLKRLAEATGKAITSTAPIRGRVLTLQVDVQKKNPDFTKIERYLPENHVAEPF